MPTVSRNSLLSPRVRMFLIIGVTLLTSSTLAYILLFDPNSSMRFLKARPLALLLVATVTAVLSGWVQARNPRFRAGLLFKSLGRGFVLFGAGAALLTNLPSAVLASAL